MTVVAAMILLIAKASAANSIAVPLPRPRPQLAGDLNSAGAPGGESSLQPSACRLHQ
jgi:hypothetical protein